jgi:hypothetical protein
VDDVKSEVINFRLNPKRTDDKLILDFLDKKLRGAGEKSGMEGREATRTDVIKELLLKVIDGEEKRRQEQLKSQETEKLIAQVTEAVKVKFDELMQAHDTKMMAALFGAMAGNQAVFMNTAVRVPDKENPIDETEAKEKEDLQDLTASPSDEDKPMDAGMKAGLAAMFG